VRFPPVETSSVSPPEMGRKKRKPLLCPPLRGEEGKEEDCFPCSSHEAAVAMTAEGSPRRSGRNDCGEKPTKEVSE